MKFYYFNKTVSKVLYQMLFKSVNFCVNLFQNRVLEGFGLSKLEGDGKVNFRCSITLRTQTPATTSIPAMRTGDLQTMQTTNPNQLLATSIVGLVGTVAEAVEMAKLVAKHLLDLAEDSVHSQAYFDNLPLVVAYSFQTARRNTCKGRHAHNPLVLGANEKTLNRDRN